MVVLIRWGVCCWNLHLYLLHQSQPQRSGMILRLIPLSALSNDFTYVWININSHQCTQLEVVSRSSSAADINVDFRRRWSLVEKLMLLHYIGKWGSLLLSRVRLGTGLFPGFAVGWRRVFVCIFYLWWMKLNDCLIITRRGCRPHPLLHHPQHRLHLVKRNNEMICH